MTCLKLCHGRAARSGQRAILDRYHWEQDAAILAASVSLVARSRGAAVA
jgi:hypothetical protein